MCGEKEFVFALETGVLRSTRACLRGDGRVCVKRRVRFVDGTHLLRTLHRRRRGDGARWRHPVRGQEESEQRWITGMGIYITKTGVSIKYGKDVAVHITTLALVSTNYLLLAPLASSLGGGCLMVPFGWMDGHS